LRRIIEGDFDGVKAGQNGVSKGFFRAKKGGIGGGAENDDPGDAAVAFLREAANGGVRLS
jgi:hypothetical protein